MCMLKLRKYMATAMVVGASCLCTSQVMAFEKSREPVFGFGTPVTSEELARFLSVRPDGKGLPPGEGNYTDGKIVYQRQCAGCHGVDLNGVPGRMAMPPEMAIMATDKLIGGRGTLTSTRPVFTVESHWPYATTLWDYVKRTMPLMSPGSLTDNEVYSLVAYILGKANIIAVDQTMNDQTLPGVIMPNRHGFVSDPRPEFVTAEHGGR